MLYKEMIAEIKQEIKTLTAAQIEDKKILRQPHGNNIWKTMSSAFKRAGTITMYLNFYNQIRGKDVSHSVRKYDCCWGLKNTKGELEAKYKNVIQESQVETTV